MLSRAVPHWGWQAHGMEYDLPIKAELNGVHIQEKEPKLCDIRRKSFAKDKGLAVV